MNDRLYRLGRSHKDTVYQQIGPQPATTDPRVAIFVGAEAEQDALFFCLAATRGAARRAASRAEDAAFAAKPNECRKCPDSVPSPSTRPNGCPSCTKDQDCECYEHQDWPDRNVWRPPA